MPPNSQLPSKKRKASIASKEDEVPHVAKNQKQGKSDPSISTQAKDDDQPTASIIAASATTTESDTATSPPPSKTPAATEDTSSSCAAAVPVPASQSPAGTQPSASSTASISSSTHPSSASTAAAKKPPLPPKPANSTTNNTNKSQICPSRLPSKKRKGSHDSSSTAAAAAAASRRRLDSTETASTASARRTRLDSFDISNGLLLSHSDNNASLRKHQDSLESSHLLPPPHPPQQHNLLPPLDTTATSTNATATARRRLDSVEAAMAGSVNVRKFSVDSSLGSGLSASSPPLGSQQQQQQPSSSSIAELDGRERLDSMISVGDAAIALASSIALVDDTRKLSFDLSQHAQAAAAADNHSHKSSFDISTTLPEEMLDVAASNVLLNRKDSVGTSTAAGSSTLGGLGDLGDRKDSLDISSTKEGPTDDRKLSLDISQGSSAKDSLGLAISAEERKHSLDISQGSGSNKNNNTKSTNVASGLIGAPQRRHRTSSLSSLDDDLARRKWSQDSTLAEFSPSRKDLLSSPGTSGALLHNNINKGSAGTPGGGPSKLPKFDELMEHAPTLPDNLDPLTSTHEGEGDSKTTARANRALSMKAPPPVDAVTMTVAVSSLAEVQAVASALARSDGDDGFLLLRKSGGRDRIDSFAFSLGEGSNHDRSRKESFSSSLESGDEQEQGAAHPGAALEHLDALNPKDKKESKAAALKEGDNDDDDVDEDNIAGEKVDEDDKDDDDDTSSSAATFASKGQLLLLEAIALQGAGGGTVTGSGSAGQRRERLESIGSQGLLLGRERFESMGSVLDAGGLLSGENKNNRRERLESWGGMSDLSGLHLSSSANNQHPGAVDFMAMAEEAQLPDLNQPRGVGAPAPAAGDAANVPSRIALQRDRLNSIASLSEASLTGMPLVPNAEPGTDMTTIDIQAFVSATVASMGDQLAEIAGAVELATGGLGTGTDDDIDDDGLLHFKDHTDESEASSAASPMIGAAALSDRRGRARSSSVNSTGLLSVNQEDLAAAVDAAQAAAAGLDLAALGKTGTSVSSGDRHAEHPLEQQYGSKAKKTKSSTRRIRRQLPLKTRGRGGSETSEGDRRNNSKSNISEEEQEQIRERARAAASSRGPPGKVLKSKSKPIKKRAKRKSPEPDKPKSGGQVETPKHSNRKSIQPDSMPSAPFAPSLEPSSATAAAPKPKAGNKDKANQKWECMFEHLLKFIGKRRKQETEGLPEEEKDLWVWDGNVPTNEKADDGKAIGRWVNNQRTAKTKGSLKEERIKRLEDAGLKWSVLSSNSWNDTLEELRLYVAEQTKDGSEWDGNVPTNYQIKARADGHFAGEDRNLGRWVNRQRSLFQAGKLRKDRQVALEKLGLKWSMLDSTTWDAMYGNLIRYIEEKKATSGEWDGNVPANYRTQDNPPRALGRWINRQRTARVKRKLKPEHVDKLTVLGLKWSVHERTAKELEEIDREEIEQAAASAAAAEIAKEDDIMNGTRDNTVDEQKPETISSSSGGGLEMSVVTSVASMQV